MVNNPHAKIVAFKLILSTESKSVELNRLAFLSSHQTSEILGSPELNVVQIWSTDQALLTPTPIVRTLFVRFV